MRRPPTSRVEYYHGGTALPQSRRPIDKDPSLTKTRTPIRADRDCPQVILLGSRCNENASPSRRCDAPHPRRHVVNLNLLLSGIGNVSLDGRLLVIQLLLAFAAERAAHPSWRDATALARRWWIGEPLHPRCAA